MSSTDELHRKIDALAGELQSLSAELAQDDAGRKKLLGLIMKATAELEAPIEKIWRMIMSVRLLRKTCHRQVYIINSLTCEATRPSGVDGNDPYGHCHGFGPMPRAENG